MNAKVFLFVAVLACGGVAPSFAAEAPHAAIPGIAATGIDTVAQQAIMVDEGTGAVLLDKNADEHMPTSSMSKTMTLYMVFEALKNGQLKLDDELPVSEKAWKMGGSKMFIKVGSRVKVEDLIRGVIVQSGNDAAVALAEGLAGSEDALVARMNIRAKKLGMLNSHFMNATGWPDPDHYSTARDLALLAQHLIQDFPEYYHYFGEKEFTYNKIHQPNRDLLLGRVTGVDGLKTGHTEIAGYSLISSALRNGRRLILVVNGLQSMQQREEEPARLLEWGFRNFEDKTIFKQGDLVNTAKVWLGQEPEVPLVAEKDVTVALPVDQRSEMKMTVSYKGPLSAPLKKDTLAGTLRIEIPGQAPFDVNLLTGADVEREGLWGRVTDRLKYLLKKSKA